VQGGSSARAQCLLVVDADAAHKQGKSVNQSGCNGRELEADTLTDWQPVQLPP